MIIIKSPREIALMREAGHLLSDIFDAIGPMCVPGTSTQEINDRAEEVMKLGGGESAEKGYYGYPGAICASVNEVLLHGIPSPKKILKDGDIVSLDIVVRKNGYCADACRSYLVGICPEHLRTLLEVTEESFWNAVRLVKPGIHLGDVSHAIEATVKAHGYSVPREFTGHGIGKEMHEDPYIPDYGTPGTGDILREGMTLAIEPMVMEGKPHLRTLGDGWTTVTKDGKYSAHYENTIVVNKDGYEVLTMREERR